MLSLKHLALIGLTAGGIVAGTGCDGASPDSQTREKINKGQVTAIEGSEAARSEAISLLTEAATIPDASNAAVAQAKAALGQVQYEAGLEMLREANRKELAASQIALQIAALGGQLGNSASLVEAYKAREPKKAKSDLDQKIVDAKGGPDKLVWIADTKIGSLTAAEQEVSRVQGEIAKRQSELKDVETQRVAALEEAETSLKASESGKGREAVDAYKKGADARKKAADLQAKIDLLNGQLMPLEKDLAIAVGQQQILAGAVKLFEDEGKTLDAGWTMVQSKIAVQEELMKQIATAADPSTQPSATPSAAGLSMAGKAALLKQTVEEAEALRTKAAEAIVTAIKSFADAFSSANTAVNTDMNDMVAKRPAVKSVVEIAQAVMTPEVYKLRQASAERTLAEMQTAKAAGISARIKLREMLTPIMQKAAQPLPKELDVADMDKQLAETLTEANSKYEDAKKNLEDIEGSGGRNDVAKSTKKAALVAKVFVLYGQEQLANLEGKAGAAKTFHAEDLESVKKGATEEGVLYPKLPSDLASVIPPPPAPATAPTEPSTPTDATATADSPDVTAIRTVLTTFVEAASKGDLEAAKAVSQIDPGQEAQFDTFAGIMGKQSKLLEALKAKFPDIPSNAGGDINTAMKASKIRVEGETGFLAGGPGGEIKLFVKAGEQWKLHFGELDEKGKQTFDTLGKLSEALTTLTTDLEAGKYPTAEDFGKATMQAIMPIMMGGAGAPAPAPGEPGATPPAPTPAPGEPGAAAPAPTPAPEATPAP